MQDPAAFLTMLPIAIAALVFLSRSMRQINQWEVGLVFTLGKYAKKLSPGLNFVLPLVQRVAKVDMRLRNRDLPPQQVITGDNMRVGNPRDLAR